MGSTEDYKRVVVESVWDGSLLPGRMEELKREVTLKPGSRVTGSVFGYSIRIEAPAVVCEAVYATRDLTVSGIGDVRLLSAAGARETVTIQRRKGVTAIGGDVNSRDVSLAGAVVRGGVYADRVHLEDCLVLGVVLARESATLAGCTVLTAMAQKLTFGVGCSLVLPYASATDLNLLAPVGLGALGPGDNALGPEDVVIRDGRSYLTAGRRLSDLTQVRKYVDTVGRYVAALTAADVRRTASMLDGDTASLPTGFADRLPALVSLVESDRP